MHFETACIWDKCSEEKNENTVAIEAVMSEEGPVIFALLSKNAAFSKSIVGWFYEEGLRILCTKGLRKALRCSFMRRFGDIVSGENFMIYIQKRNRVMLISSGGFEYINVVPDDLKLAGMENKRIKKEERICFETGKVSRRGAFLICSKELTDVLSKENVEKILACQRNESIAGVRLRLEEMKRRAKSRGVNRSICAVYIRRKTWNT